jgi:amino acid adenylation domain-containing protein
MTGADDPQESRRFVPVEFDPFAPVPSDDPSAPTTEGQREIWAAVHMGHEASCAYNQCFVMRLTGAFSVDQMRTAISALFTRHEALRLVYDPSGERQVVTAAKEVDVPLIDLSEHPAAVRAAEVDALLAAEVQEPFDLEVAPARARIVREAPDRHLVVLSAHHIICDGWSSGILLRDLGLLYGAERYGLPANLSAPGRFTDFARRQFEPGYQVQAEAAEQYWTARFPGEVPVLDLPPDRPRPLVKTYRAAMQMRRLPDDLQAALRRTGARQGVTLYALLLGAFQAFVYRLTGHADLVIGVPVAAQAAADERALVGHGTNLLPVRVEIDGTQSMSHHLKVARTALLDAQEHQAVTFGTLVRKLRVPRDPSRTPLVTGSFNVDRLGSPPALPDVTVDVSALPKAYLNFDFEVNIVDTGTALTVEWTHNTDLFDAATIQRWLGHFQTLLEATVMDVDRAIDRLPLLSEIERRELLEVPGPESHVSDTEGCLHVLFETVASRRPDAPAVAAEDGSLTYGELNRRANRLAHALIRAGVQPDALVGLCVQRSLDLVVGILGILKAGGAYVPLDPTYPRERLRFMTEDAGITALVVQPALLELVASPGIPVITLGALGDGGASDDENVRLRTPSDQLAYVIYTSGSTGTPKGVMVTHRNVVRLFRSTEQWFEFGEHDVWTLFHSYAFDFSVWELWGALLYGGRVVVVPHAVCQTPDAFLSLLADEGVTVLNQTPSAFAVLMQADAAAPSALPALRLVVFGGEALDVPALRPWFERHGDQHPRLVNMYGITETTVHVTYRPLKSEDARAGCGSVIGRPIPDLALHVLDDRLEPVPIGVTGEIYVGGAGVARGYLNRAELTGERFLSDPFSSEPGARLYRSGDLARRLANGDVEYLGRRDQQVKIRGHRIELGEIEDALSAYPTVRQAVVIARDDAVRGRRLVAYIVNDDGGSGLGGELRTHLRQRLPEYMVPSSFVAVPKLPLTANGKIDRRALLDFEEVAPTSSDDYVAPRTDTERAIAAIWQEVLGLERVGVYDNFFDLGGHSLLSIRVVQAIAERLRRKLNPGQLIRQNLAQIASRCDELPPVSETVSPRRPTMLDALRRLMGNR